MLRVLALAIIVLAPALAQGRLPVRTYESSHGLGALFAHSLAQDAQGFIYAAGGEGLFKGDGQDFYPIPLPGKSINRQCLVADREGPVWTATPAGLFVLDPGRTEAVQLTQGLPGGPIEFLGRDARGRHWVLAGGYPCREVQPRSFAPAPGWPSGTRATGLILRPGSERILAFTPDRLLEQVGGRWEPIPGPPLALKDTYQEGIADGRGQLWMRSRLGLWRQPSPGSPWLDLRAATGSRPATSLGPDEADGLWITGRFGIAHARGDAWEPLPIVDQFPASQARATLVDWDGNLWTSVAGLHMMLGRGRRQIFGPAQGLTALDAWALLLDRRGRVWAGTGDGLSVSSPQGWTTVLKGEGIVSLGEAPDGAIWAAGNDDGSILRIDPVSLKPERITVLKKAEGRFGRGFAFVDGEVWVAALAHGIHVGRRTAGGWAWHPIDRAEVREGRARYLSQDRLGRVYLPTRDGLQVFDHGTWTCIPNRVKPPAYVSVLDPQGDLWVGSFESITLERYRFTPRGPEHVQSLALPELHQGMHVYSVASDTRGWMWVGTSQGLLRLMPGEPSSTVRFTTSEGMPSNDSNRPGILATPDGEVWVPTSSGLGRFSDQDAAPWPPLRAPRLSRIQFPGRALPMPPQDLSFHPRDREMTWHFCVPTYEHQPRLLYEVQLDDGSMWLGIPRGTMGFSHLAPGRHEVRVRARLPEGQASPVTRIAFTLLPRWWERRWVQALGLAAGLGLAGLGIITYVRRFRRRNQWLEQVVLARTADLRTANADLLQARDLLERAARGKAAHLASMNHELRNPLNTILLYTEMMLDADHGPAAQREAFAGIREAGLKARDLIGSILDLAKLEAGVLALDPRVIEPSVLVDELAHHLPRDLSLSASLEPGGPVTADPELLRRILAVLVGFERTGATPRQVHLHLRPSPGWTAFDVHFPAPGMTEAQLDLLFLDFTQDWSQRSISWHPLALELTICRCQAEYMGGRLEVRSSPAEGTCFTLLVPNLRDPGTRQGGGAAAQA